LRGRTIAFGGRALEKDVPAKYLNSPETPLFHKGNNLYNGATARKAAHDGAPIVVVEGYVDVIAMVTSGYEGAVAPLGTALTEEQLALIWRMTDEPVLCFDGDGAGRRAAYRAVDLALPHIKPGKTVKFALLPEGQDPDDLARSGGRAAINEVMAAARPLADILWQRETEAGGFDTPERRAGLDQRVAEVTNLIGDPSVRKYYKQDLDERVRTLFAPIGRESGRERWGGNNRSGGNQNSRWQDRGRQQGNRAGASVIVAPSARLASSQIVRGAMSALSPREALILVAAVNHPWLLDTHAEELAELEFRHGDGDKLRRAILEAASGHTLTPAEVRAAITTRGLGALLARVEASITHTSDWPAREGAAEEDVGLWWTHVVSLHRKSRTLHKELKDAEVALGSEPSEENLAWLQDVQSRLTALEGAEALIDGFGGPSGRPVRSF
jgi:DNA primase